MSNGSITSLVLIAAIAVLAPLLAERLRRFNVPSVVLELLFGILVGPSVLKLAHPTDVIDGFANIGLAFLMFLAGYELDLRRVRGRPLTLAAWGWLLSLAMALSLAVVLVSSGFALNTLIVGLALTTTALGTLLPMLHDAGLLGTRFGTHVIAVGSVGEFGPIVAVAVLLTRKDPLVTGALLVLFIVVATCCALLASRSQPPRVVALLRRHLDTSAQLPVRISVLLIFFLIYLAFKLGLDVLLGAFAAGQVIRLFTMGGDDSNVIRSKLEAIGFGFVIPIFFIVSGMHFDLQVFIHRPITLLRIPLFLLLFLLVRGLPVLLLYRHELSGRLRAALALFSATGLPLVVVITSLGVAQHKMRPENAAALVGAGIISVLLLPMLGLNRLRATPGLELAGAELPDETFEEDERL